MVATKVSSIKEKVLTGSSESERSKGKELYEQKSIENISYDDYRIKAQVKEGNSVYNVSIVNYNAEQIKKSCSCNFYGSVCRHILALTFHLDAILNPLTGKPNYKRKRESSVCLKCFGDNKYGIPSTLIDDYLLFKDFFISDVVFKNHSLIVKVERRSQNYYNDHIVEIFYERGNFYSKCNCKFFKQEMCEKEVFAALKIYESKVDIAKLLQDGEEFYRHNFLLENGIPFYYNRKENIEIVFDHDFNIDINLRNDLENFIPLTLFAEGEVEKRFSPVKHVKLRDYYFENFYRDYKLGFYFADTDQGISVIPIYGKATIKGDNLYSSLEVFRDEDLQNYDCSDEEQQAIFLSKQLNSVYSSYKKLAILDEIWTYLEDHPLLYAGYRKTSEIKKSNLLPIKLSPHRTEIIIKQSQEKDFYRLDVKLNFNDTEYDLNECQQYGEFCILKDYQLILVKNQAQSNFLKNRELFDGKYYSKITKNDFQNHLLLPLAKYHKLEGEGQLKNYEVEGKLIQKQLFIDEMGEFLLFTPCVIYEPDLQVNLFSDTTPVYKRGEEILFVQRDKDKEFEYIESLREANLNWTGRAELQGGFALQIELVLKDFWLFDFLIQLQKADVEVLGFKTLRKFKYSPHKAKVKFNVESQQDWFETQIDIAFGDTKVSLNDLRKFIKNKDKYINLSDGTLGVLTEDWVSKLQKMFRYGQVKKDKVLISNMKFSIVDELFDQREHAEILLELAEKKRKLKEFTNIKQTKVPEIINAELRGYQKEGLNWMNFLYDFSWGGILADDMGLGKTLQVITFMALLKQKQEGTNLIVVPTTLIFNWENELKKFCPDLKYLTYYSGNRKKDHRQFEKYDLVITTYGLLVNDIQILMLHKFNYIVLDESQAIKNTQSQRYKAACLLRSKHRLALTGTPIENNTFDLYAQMTFVNPSFLGSALSFRNDYSIPIDKEQNKEIAAELQKVISPFVLRRTKEKVAKELPPKTEGFIYCVMEEKQRKIYDAYRNKYRNYLLNKVNEDGLEKSKIHILEGLTKLRQICDSPNLLSDDVYENDSIKITELMRHIKSKTGQHKIIVFSQFVSMLNLIRDELENEQIAYQYLDGSSSQQSRQESVQEFQTDTKVRVFLISLKAGGTGLNLIAADYVYLVDPWWNPAVENQAIDRCYRIGQDKKVFAYRMICKDTIEEKIINYQNRKKAVAADLIQAEEGFMKNISIDDLEDIFGYGKSK